MSALAALAGWREEWQVPAVSAAVVTADGVAEGYGEPERPFRLASVTKLLTAYAVLVAVEEGAVELDEPAGPPGATVRHLLAHAGGYGFASDAPVIARPGTRRVYSNRGIEHLAEHLAGSTGIAFADYLREAVLDPLGMASTQLRGSPAFEGWSTAGDLARFTRELLRPAHVAPETLVEAVTVQFPGLSGILPGVGRFDPLDWGLGFERAFGRPGHWTGTALSTSAFGHFGGSGTFLWVDPALQVGCVCLTDHDFGAWALAAWPRLSQAVADGYGTRGPGVAVATTT